jgi:2-polyprenyl-3-methyl-5-hydroxy-6-metoxy-1,4-benzoquinol methylase
MATKEQYKKILDSMIQQEKDFTCGPDSSQRYFQLDSKRFALTIDICRKEILKDAAILDIGRSHFTKILSENFKNVTSLGLDPNIDDGGHRELTPLMDVNHINFDLENALNIDQWPDKPDKFGLVVCTEVIEHVTVSPHVLFMLFHHLLNDGGKLLLSTPNAVSLRKRINMIQGKHPFEKLRLYKTNPGHYREYTAKEVCSYLTSDGFSVEKCFFFNSHENNFTFGKGNFNPLQLLKLLPLVIPELRDSFFIIAQKHK